jgi:hypothetical protein
MWSTLDLRGTSLLFPSKTQTTEVSAAPQADSAERQGSGPLQLLLLNREEIPTRGKKSEKLIQPIRSVRC